MAELADALDSKSSSRKGVRVRPPLRARGRMVKAGFTSPQAVAVTDAISSSLENVATKGYVREELKALENRVNKRMDRIEADIVDLKTTVARI